MNIFQHVRKYANEPETVSELFRFCFLFLFQICFRTVLDVGTFVSSFSFVSVLFQFCFCFSFTCRRRFNVSLEVAYRCFSDSKSPATNIIIELRQLLVR